MSEEQRSVFQGVVYYYRDNRVYCRYVLTLRDAVDGACLQAALDAARPLAGYFFQTVVWDKRKAHFAPNDAPCRVFEGAAQPQMPEQTNGYLFSLHYEGRTVYFDWFHFLTDGRGASQLVTLVLKDYCNRRYGTAFVCEPLASDPPYDVEAILAAHPESYVKNDMKREVTQTYDGEPALARVRLDKQSLIDLAVHSGVKPISAMMAVLCLALGDHAAKDTVMYSFPADARDVVGAPNALYNCTSSFQWPIDVRGASFSDLAACIDANVREALQPEKKLVRFAQQMGWVYQVFQQKASLSIQKRVFQMGEYISGFPADFWLSYLGSLLRPADPELAAYVETAETWVLPDGASLGLEVVSLHGVLTLCIENKIPRPGFVEAVRRAFEAQGVRVLEAADLPPIPQLQTNE